MTTVTETATTIKVWSKEEIKELLDSRPAFVGRSLIVMLARQTADEAQGGYTSHANGQGFSAFDAEFLTSLAKQFSERNSLSEKQLVMARKSLKRYAGQLVDVANANITPEELKAHKTSLRIEKREAKKAAKLEGETEEHLLRIA